MLTWLKTIWTGSPPVAFESAFDLAQSIDRLRAATRRSAFSAAVQEQAVGTVRETRVSLYRVIPLIRNSFKPIFVGRFEEAGGKVVLRGSFALHWFTRLFMAAWFGILSLFAVIVLFADAGSAETAEALALVAGMMVAGLGLMALGQWFSRKDPAWLSAVIVSALSGQEPVPSAISGGLPAHLLVFLGLVAAEGILHLVSAVTTLVPFETEGTPRFLTVLLGAAMLVWAFGLYRRNFLAWRAGFAVFAYWAYTFFDAATHPPLAAAELMDEFQSFGTVFTIVGVLVLGLGARWWYAQRVHFRRT